MHTPPDQPVRVELWWQKKQSMKGMGHIACSQQTQEEQSLEKRWAQSVSASHKLSRFRASVLTGCWAERQACTGSNDCSWRMFHLPSGEPVMSGEGHSGWLAAVAFHPQATVLASGAGDAAVKLWSFRRRRCVATLQGDQTTEVLLGSVAVYARSSSADVHTSCATP